MKKTEEIAEECSVEFPPPENLLPIYDCDNPDKYLFDLFKKSCTDDLILKEGVIASGDIFCTDPLMAQKIKEKFDAFCVEMEGASIAQVCFLSGIPFIVIRSISDVPNNNNQIDFDKFLKEASEKVAKVLVRTIAKINNL